VARFSTADDGQVRENLCFSQALTGFCLSSHNGVRIANVFFFNFQVKAHKISARAFDAGKLGFKTCKTVEKTLRNTYFMIQPKI